MNTVRIFKGYALSELHEQIAAFGSDRKLSPIHTAIAVDRNHNAVSYLITVVYEPVKLQGFAQGGYVGQSRCDSSEPVGVVKSKRPKDMPLWMCHICGGQRSVSSEDFYCPVCETKNK